MELFRNKEKGNVCPVFVKGGRELGLTASGCIVLFSPGNDNSEHLTHNSFTDCIKSH